MARKTEKQQAAESANLRGTLRFLAGMHNKTPADMAAIAGIKIATWYTRMNETTPFTEIELRRLANHFNMPTWKLMSIDPLRQGAAVREVTQC